ncbi:MAG: glycosyltransferase family 4 protein, partial [bacterium]|nr:glycosyltransferase family 4 protein [bacterium]
MNVKVLDIINTAASAKELLFNRVGAVNRQAGFENWIACGPGPELDLFREAGIPVEVIDSPRGISPRHVSPISCLAALWRLARLIRKHRFDIVHTHGPVQGVLGRLAAWLARTPVVIHTEHGAVYHENQHPAARRLYMSVERLMSAISDHLLFMTRSEQRYAIKHGITARSQVHFIGNGISLRNFSPRPRPAKQSDDPKVVIVSVARLDPIKNIPMLLRAVDRLRRSKPSIECRILGDGICQGELARWVEENGLGSHVRFLGYCNDVPDVLADADIAVLTSIKEGVPRGLMEPMALGLPVVATNVKGNRDVVVDGECGFLVPLHDDAALAERLSVLIENPGLRARMGVAGLRRVRDVFDEEVVIGKITALYETLFPRQFRPAARFPGCHGLEPESDRSV